MLAECRKALRVTAEEFDTELMDLMKAAADDLRIAGVVLPGFVSYAVDSFTGKVTDTSTLKDDLCIRAILTYAAMRFGNPPNYERLREAYETQKAQLMHADGYTVWDGDAG